MDDQQHQNEAADGRSALTAVLGTVPAFWHYRINRNWDGFSKELPPEDAYDKGTLIPLYTQDALIELLAALRAVQIDAVGVGGGENVISDATRAMVDAAIKVR